MNIKRILTAGFFSLILATAAFGSGIETVRAENNAVDSAPSLEEAKAKNTGGTSAKEAGDSVILEFSETTNKFAITASNIDDEFELNNSHSFLDGSGAIGSATWSDDGEELVIVFSAATALPTVSIGDTVAISGTNVKDLNGNAFSGEAVIDGSFSSVDDNEDCDEPTVSTTRNGNDDDSDADEDEDEAEDEDEDSNDDDEDNDCDHHGEHERGKFRCGNGLQNGRLYKLEGSPTVYLMAACRFKPFRGEAAFRSRGHKFQDIQVLATLPTNVSVSDEPVVPAEGTLVKGSDATVYFIGKNGKRKGFVSAVIFLNLGFKFDQVDQISDSDLGTIENDTDLVDDSTNHPDGALVKCTSLPAVFVVIDQLRFPFANADAFTNRGHRFDHVLVIDCSKFAYQEAAPISN